MDSRSGLSLINLMEKKLTSLKYFKPFPSKVSASETVKHILKCLYGQQGFYSYGSFIIC